MVRYVVPLDSLPPPFEVQDLGGKGAKLAELTFLKYNVPPGFIVTSHAFGAFFEANPTVETEIHRSLAAVRLTNPNALERLSARIREIITAGDLPDTLAIEVLTCFDRLSPRASAVRSSAVSEDSNGSSFAGQFDSYLNVGRSDLLGAIRHCWSSYFTARSLAYRESRGIGLSARGFAVVVQSMIDADISGVCFTRHPVTKDVNLIYVDAVWGLGESLVNGTISPDSYVVSKYDLTEINVTQSVQERMLARDEKLGTGTCWRTLPPSFSEARKLGPSVLRRLATLCMDLERNEGTPCDIEWAIRDNRVYVLQCRPITN